MKMIQTHQLTKKFGQQVAVADVDLNVEQGEIYGFLGLNGAGKTTTMRMFLQMIHPTSGTIELAGHDASRLPQQFWNNVGYLIETPHAYPNFTVRENLTMYAQQRLIPRDEIQSRIDTIADELLLTPYLGMKAKNLSLGNNQKVGLAKALIHHPSLLLLDEPTNGLDPESIVAVRHLLTQLAHNGTTVFISSHLLGEMAMLVDDIGILNHGRMVREISRTAFDQERQQLTSIQGVADTDGLTNWLTDHDLTAQTAANGIVTVAQVPENQQATLLSQIEAAGFRPSRFEPIQESLEDFFLRQIGVNVDD